MKKWLFNPFVYVAGTKALLIGWGIMLLTAVIAWRSNMHFDGAIDAHSTHSTALSVSLIEQAIDWGMLVLLFYPGGLLFSRSSIRFIDVAGTLALARWPMFFAAVLGFGLKAPDTDSLKLMMAAITPLMIVFSVLLAAFSIWMIALMYNAFRLSCNMKGEKAVAVFIGALVLAEFSSHFILHKIYTLLI